MRVCLCVCNTRRRCSSPRTTAMARCVRCCRTVPRHVIDVHPARLLLMPTTSGATFATMTRAVQGPLKLRGKLRLQLL